MCRGSGALVVDADGRDLVVADADVRRQLVAAGTPELLEQLHGGDRTVTIDLDLDGLLVAARRAAAAGAAIVLDAFGGASNVRDEGAGRLGERRRHVERARRSASSLHDAAPELAFFGEETGGERADVGWFVDPLDGTANFVHGFPVVGVSVGLVADGGRWSASSTRRCSAGCTPLASVAVRTCNDEPIRISERDPEEAICATGFPFRSKRDRLPQYFPVFERALLTFEDLRRAGAASLDLAWTAAGVFDGYFEQALGTWDVAAGGLLVREAGGVVTDWQGDDRAWLRSGDIVAAPAPVHERILEVIAGGRSGREPSASAHAHAGGCDPGQVRCEACRSSVERRNGQGRPSARSQQ